ncbi:MAG: hypothetical protein AVDCRST_MAG53-593, partial [uncultured Solirubrobacteraceae bacterium]
AALQAHRPRRTRPRAARIPGRRLPDGRLRHGRRRVDRAEGDQGGHRAPRAGDRPPVGRPARARPECCRRRHAQGRGADGRVDDRPRLAQRPGDLRRLLPGRTGRQRRARRRRARDRLLHRLLRDADDPASLQDTERAALV